jgi:transposase
MKSMSKELTALVTTRGSTLLQLHGIGPSGAARLLADAGDIHRFADRDKFAFWNGTAPLDASSGNQEYHRLSRAGNRRINRVLHIMAIVQLRNQTHGRAYYDARKAGGVPSMMAMRPQAPPVQRRLRPHARRPETARGGPGRATGNDY